MKLHSILQSAPNLPPASGRHCATYAVVLYSLFCTASLKRLGLDYVDLLFCHRPDPETPIEETVRAMNWVRRLGCELPLGPARFERSVQGSGIVPRDNHRRDCAGHELGEAPELPLHGNEGKSMELPLGYGTMQALGARLRCCTPRRTLRKPGG